MRRKNLCIFLHHMFWVDPEAAVHLEHFTGVKKSLNLFLFVLKWFRKGSTGHFLVLYLQTVLWSLSFRVRSTLSSTCSSGAAILIFLAAAICQKLVLTFMLSLVSAVSCWSLAEWKAPSCYIGDGTIWRNVKVEVDSTSRVSCLSLWALSSEGQIFEGTPGAFELLWV